MDKEVLLMVRSSLRGFSKAYKKKYGYVPGSLATKRLRKKRLTAVAQWVVDDLNDIQPVMSRMVIGTIIRIGNKMNFLAVAMAKTNHELAC